MAEGNSPEVGSTELQTPEGSNATGENLSRSSSNTKPVSQPPSTTSQVAAAPVTATTTAPTFPPPKTDKPRPHVCTTCMRSFARLEHLKRHERSHTKEKPFECPSCNRCFARRDLLLRHQQKLHSTTTPSSRPRNGRRESTTGVANGRVRKNSVVGATQPNMRPRANTLSHLDSSAMGIMTSGGFARQFGNSLHGHHHSFNGGMALNPGFGFRNMGMANNSAVNGLPRLETHGLPMDGSNGLRTAPPFGGFGAEFDMGGMGFEEDSNTINPHALHMPHQSGLPMDNGWGHSHPMYSALPTSQTLTEDDGFDWVTHGFENQMSFAHGNENAIDDSSPSAMSTNSPANFNEAFQNGYHHFMDKPNGQMTNAWQLPVSNAGHMVHSPMSMDMNSFFGDMSMPPGDTISPKPMLTHKNSGFEHSFPTPPELTMMDPTTAAMLSNGHFALPFKHENLASTASTASIDSSLRQSSVTTTPTSEIVSEHMRNVLIAGLSQSSGFGQRKQSQPAISSPLSPANNAKSKGFHPISFPTTQELQRYVGGYIKYFHPHLPFLHIATLNFESIDQSGLKGPNAQSVPWSASAGGCCLLLSIAALGALFENEMVHSKDLFEHAKRMISSYLEERRRHHTGKSQYPTHQRSDRDHTPLWLVQAMLLNVIYGHNCGDKQAADIASNHCAALVSLARGAELTKPYPAYTNGGGMPDGPNVAHAQSNGISPDSWNNTGMETGDSDWYEWKTMEERKRTLYAVFVLSSMLVTAYNRAPALTNSEIRLDLPCDEDLWGAETAQAWRAFGGISAVEVKAVQFASALTHLLTAAQRARRAVAQQAVGEPWTTEENELHPSSFGCLVLINALHNYIWETRQRHLGRQWTPQEIESMHAHIEPALLAWSAAWNSNPTHAVERPNPFGAGPLSADSIPLLDLAYVRLFVDFGRSKEAYWQRDYDTMAQELAKGPDNAPDQSLLQTKERINSPSHVQISDNMLDNARDSGLQTGETQPAQRERHLRKAAFYAADHLLASDRLGFNLNEHNARELPIQSVLCACDSAQVLAEWATTVQERVGSSVGVIGRDDIDMVQVPAVLLLDNEDRKLFAMIDELLSSVGSKQDFGQALADAQEGGYGSRILISTSQIMARTAIWPVTKLMARSLETQAGHVKERVLNSVKVH